MLNCIHNFAYVHTIHTCTFSGGKLALSLLSNTAFGLGVTVISNWEERQLGLQWSNAGEALSIVDPLNMGAVYEMLICDIVLYMIIAWYVVHVVHDVLAHVHVCTCMYMYIGTILVVIAE